jgi:hypothetical protein
MSLPAFPCKVNLAILEDDYWVGLGKQNMDFHQVIGELIDNSISASGMDQDGDLNPFVIEIVIKKIGNEIQLKIADQGVGITLSDLTDKILAPGGRGSNPGPLNEHGFGLKNGLCVLTSNKLPFKIQTRDKEAVQRTQFYLVRSPFRKGMSIELDDPTNWNLDLRHATGEMGTRIFAATSYHFFNTLYKRAAYFDKLIIRLIEHLGVMYRGFLENSSNKLWLRCQDQGEDLQHLDVTAAWAEYRIKPIDIPYDAKGKNSIPIEIDHEGIKAKAIYEFGLLDQGKTENDSLGPPYPLKIYYKGNIPTQGLDIRVRGRVIANFLMSAIWPEVSPHNDYNKFVGELILDPNFRSVNNKTNIDPHNHYWEKLLTYLNDSGFEHKPERVTRTQTEQNVKEKLKIHLEGLTSGSTAILDPPVWGGTAVKADITHTKHDSTVDVYEVKAGTASPQDVYQLLMYWDGLVKDGKDVALGRLVASSIPPSVTNVISYLNGRKDTRNRNYNLETKTLVDLGISV